MRKVQEVLRLLLVCGLSQRQVSQASGVGRASVAEYVERVRRAGLLESWESLSGEELESRLYPPARRPPTQSERPEADWATVHQELKRKGRDAFPALGGVPGARIRDGYGYSRFCELYRAVGGQAGSVHAPGAPGRREAVRGLRRADGAGGRREHGRGAAGADLRGGAGGASSYTYAEATWSQGLADWIGSHVRAFEFLGGVPRDRGPGQPEERGHPGCRYEPDLNPTYQELAAHYGVAVIPARVRQAARQGQGRGRRAGGRALDPGPAAQPEFFSLGRAQPGDRRAAGSAQRAALPEAARAAGGRCSRASTSRPCGRCPESATSTPSGRRRGSTSTTTSRSRATTTACPTSWSSQQLDVRVTAETVECFAKGKRVASHRRSLQRRARTRRCPSTCRSATGSMRSGRRSGWSTGRRETGPVGGRR